MVYLEAVQCRSGPFAAVLHIYLVPTRMCFSPSNQLHPLQPQSISLVLPVFQNRKRDELSNVAVSLPTLATNTKRHAILFCHARLPHSRPFNLHATIVSSYPPVSCTRIFELYAKQFPLLHTHTYMYVC